MTTLNTILFASKNNGGKAGVSISDIAGLVGGANAPVATTTVPGVVLQSADVTALTSVGPGVVANTIVDVTATPTQATVNANFATLATKVNAIQAALKAAGIMA
jgi:outer membrane murein-binding lipoprotein Lpp